MLSKKVKVEQSFKKINIIGGLAQIVDTFNTGGALTFYSDYQIMRVYLAVANYCESSD